MAWAGSCPSVEGPLGLLRHSRSLEPSKSSESKFQIQPASDLNSKQTKSVNLPEGSYETHML